MPLTLDCEEVPAAGNATQVVLASIAKLDARTDNEVDHGARDQYLAGLGHGAHPMGEMYGETDQIVLQNLHLARVQPCAYLEAESREGRAYSARAADGTRRTVEYGEHAVPCGLDEATAETSNLLPDNSVVRFD